MKPPSRTTRVTLSRSPSAALSCASRLMAQARAAFCPSSIETPPPSWPLAASLPSVPKQSWPDTDHEIAGAHEAPRNWRRAGRRRQSDSKVGELFLNRSGHRVLRCAAADAQVADRRAPSSWGKRLKLPRLSSPSSAGLQACAWSRVAAFAATGLCSVQPGNAGESCA